MKEKGTAVLFIGHYKAGTTSLQAFLAANYARLLPHGILYPAVENIGFACYLARAVGARRDFPWRNENAIAPHNALAFALLVQAGHLKRMPNWFKNVPDVETMVRAIKAQTAQSSARDIVLCSEVFTTFADLPPEATDVIRDVIGPRRVRIVCTLRRPDDHLMSWHAHRLRLGDKIQPLREGAGRDYRASIHFDYARMLAHWRDAFPGAEIVVREFGDVMAAGGSVVDFTTSSGLEMPPVETLQMPPTLNVGYHRGMVEIARRANHDLPPLAARQVRKLLDRMRDKLDLPSPREIEMIGPDERAVLRREFEPVAARLRRIAGDETLFTDLARMERLAPVPELAAAQDALAQLTSQGADALGLDAPAAEFLDGLRISAAA